MATYGIDLSHGNDPINWSKLSPQIQFVILKASQGIAFRDPKASSLFQSVKTKNLVQGFYHFFTFQNPGAAQANNFLDACQAIGVDWKDENCLPPCIDIENQVGKTDAESAQLDAWVEKNRVQAINSIKEYIGVIEEKTSLKPIIYTYKGFWQPTLGDPHDFSDYPLWQANYSTSPMQPFGGWNHYTIHQFSQRGSSILGNLNSDIDCDLFDGTIEQLKTLKQ